MILSPSLYTYKSEDAPEKERWVARWHKLPMIFSGPTKESVVRAADAFWSAEQAKEAAKRKAAVDRANKRRNAA